MSILLLVSPLTYSKSSQLTCIQRLPCTPIHSASLEDCCNMRVPCVLSLPEAEPALLCASSVRWVCCSRERDGILMRGESCLVTSLILLALLPPAARSLHY